MNTILQKYAVLVAWTQAVVAMVGSLFFSLIMELPPCDLCWYQRVAMYPLIIILGIGIWKKDVKGSLLYAWPLAVIGWIIAFYHNLLYYNILPESVAPCTSGVSCTTKYVEYFGFVTIPLLALVAFSVILGCFWIEQRRKS
jgi:disulfide bond formation protein DsbB